MAYRFDPANPLGERADVRIVTAIDRGLGLALHLRPGLDPSDPESLRGRVFGVDVATSGFAFGMYEPARDAGLEPGSYEVVALGSTPRRLEALLEGRCDATMLNAGNEPAGRAGRRAPARPAHRRPVALPRHRARGRRRGAPDRGDRARAGPDRDGAGDRVGRACTTTPSTRPSTRSGFRPRSPTGTSRRLADPEQGLVLDGLVDPAALRTLVEPAAHAPARPAPRRRPRPDVRPGRRGCVRVSR
ncbi:hypothetical protein GCM10025868_22700 [Angustibacter aerolatus]|uniref:Solute-binding protein family 3/N-terminal domain-containing protein n=1 Tax=Angustibacter aerolatus TaxID=1162965 RepID=A0ABQ6JIF8_9ACTN|nr:hypothetical protein [Angustibacter aerolatus]GMA87020.1 hypothetical protein GCM10025868_22700 [Angustibacter aerolatus]